MRVLIGNVDVTNEVIHKKGLRSFSTTYNFNPVSEGIVQGVVSDVVAENNRDILKQSLLDAKTAGYTTFSIDVMDAYFFTTDNIGYTTAPQEAVTIPSDMTLQMTANTHLRQQPNAGRFSTLLCVSEVNNVTISGGNLHGDRDNHDYTIATEWAHNLAIRACDNVTVTGVNIIDATGDGIDVRGNGKQTTDPLYITSSNLTITGNNIERARRNGISVTDGRNILIDNNDFVDTGILWNGIEGTLPKDAIDIEPYWSGGIKYEDAFDITISNNRESGSVGGGFEIFRGDRIIIEGNTMESAIYCTRGNDNVIRNNTLSAIVDVGNLWHTNGTAIAMSSHPESDVNSGNQCYGNTIENFATGLRVTDIDCDVYDNILNNNKTSLSIGGSGFYMQNTNINNNTISAQGRTDSDGMYIIGGTDLDNVNINYNSFDCQRKAYQMDNINVGEVYQWYFVDNTVVNGTITDTVEVYGRNTSLAFTPTHTIMIGDVDSEYTNKGAILTQINNKNPDLLLHAGDVYSRGTPAEYAATIAPTSGYPNSGFQTLINEQKYYQTYGDHEQDSNTYIVEPTPLYSGMYVLENEEPNNIGTTIFSTTDNWERLALPNGNAFPTDWKLLSFDDSSWSTVAGTFSVSGTVNTLLRKTVNSSSITSNGVILDLTVEHGCEIYINGVLRHSFNMEYPVTNTSTAINELSYGIYNINSQVHQILRMPSSYFDLVGDNQISILVKSINSASIYFRLQMINYTFPSVGIFGSMPFHSRGNADGIWTVAPYLPPNNDMYSVVSGNVEYFFMSSNSNGAYNMCGPSWRGQNSQQAHWLKDALATSTATFKALIYHTPIVTRYNGYYRDYTDYILDNTDYPLDVVFNGDTHVTECYEYNSGLVGSDSGLIVANASNNFTTTNRALGNIDAAIPSNWTSLYGNNTNGDNQFVEIKSTETTLTLDFIDKDGEVRYTKIITKNN